MQGQMLMVRFLGIYGSIGLPMLMAQLPGTANFDLPDAEDRSALIRRHLHEFADELQASVIQKQPSIWEPWDSEKKRQQLREILGSDLPLSATELSWRDSAKEPSVVFENEKVLVRKVSWRVLDTYAGEVFAQGLWVRPKSTAISKLKLILPDADVSPEAFLGIDSSTSTKIDFASDEEVVVMRLVDRDHQFSSSDLLQRQVLVNHREWIHRQSYGLGRTLTGYEVLSAEAAIEAMIQTSGKKEVAIEGHGEGARIALFTAALRDEVKKCELHGGFGPQDRMWSETLDRSLQGYLKYFGDAAVASMIAPRKLILHEAKAPVVPEVPTNHGLRLWAPGSYRSFTQAEIQKEIQQSKTLAKNDSDWIELRSIKNTAVAVKNESSVTVQKEQARLVKQWSQVSQRAVRTMEMERTASWKQWINPSKLNDWAAKAELLRTKLWEEVLGKLPEPQTDFQAKSRLLYETEKVKVYELWLEVAPKVSLWSWIGVPKDLLKSGKKAPVVVCQHGLEGLPEHVYTTDPKTRYSSVYKSYALKLAEQGYVTVAPHMPYRGEDEFRLLQRKLNASGYTIYSIAIQQHQQLLRWLKEQSFVDGEKIGLYGLSYGGKIAMRIPALLTDYKFSICSGDFNDWVMKLTSDTFPFSYIFTKEYEIWEWNLAQHFNHAEMAYLIAPRAFMVEYGHRDGVSASEYVGYEYGKVKRFYDQLGIPTQTKLGLFDGPHAIDGQETFPFIEKQFSSNRE